MADEVVISERALPVASVAGQIQPILGERLTTQVLDVAVQSAAFSARTRVIRIIANGAPIWYKIGDNTVSASANTDGNEFLPANNFVDETVLPGQYIDTAADA